MGSGRSGGRPTVEDGLTLDLGKLLRDRNFRPGTAWGGSLIWTRVGSGKEIGSITYEAHLGSECGRARLRYTTTRWNGEKHQIDDWVELTTTSQPFGGRRWWFVCPRTGQRVAKLHLPPGALTFASREAYRLAYRSQRQTPYDRAIDRAFKLRTRLGARGGIGDPIDRPKGMRWATFDRQMERVERAEEVVDAHLWFLVRKIGG